jgi:glutamine synthetase adenylyltransferase
MDPDDCDFLSASYLFLRKCLNAMRMCLDGPADGLPENPDLKRKLALCLGKQPHKLFFTECRERMERIRGIYNRVFTVKTGEAEER